MKTAMVDASSYARLAAVHALGRTGEIADGIFYQERAGLVTGQILHIWSAQHPVRTHPGQDAHR
ncbi:hypothetical protein [Dactylosporangium sp. NPDC051484]|uniref:hypothetical protein n=1 Tax=Dactylosporangium sp. NPDC051484 TaxID=3154942 RepID=UPI00344E594D